jgi:hypothetical protein
VGHSNVKNLKLTLKSNGMLSKKILVSLDAERGVKVKNRS